MSPRTRLTRGPRHNVATLFASATFALSVYLIATDSSSVVTLAALAVFALLALRACGLRRAVGEVTPNDGHVRVETEFKVDED